MEFRDIYDENRKIIRRSRPSGIDLRAGEFLRMVEAWIVDTKGRILIQQRSFDCIVYPGYWTLTTGHFQAGEDEFDACIREIREELGLSVGRRHIEHIASIEGSSDNHMLWDIMLVRKNAKIRHIKLDPSEVRAVRWVYPDQLRELMKSDNTFYYPKMEEIIDHIESLNKRYGK